MLHFRLSCVVALSLSGIWSGQLLAVPYTFDPSMLDGGNSMVDLSLFEEGAQMPGIYPVNIVLGEETVDRRNLAFHLQREPDGKRSLQPCLTVEQLSRYGIRTEKYPGLATGRRWRAVCTNKRYPTGQYDVRFFPPATDYQRSAGSPTTPF